MNNFSSLGNLLCQMLFNNLSNLPRVYWFFSKLFLLSKSVKAVSAQRLIPFNPLIAACFNPLVRGIILPIGICELL